LPDALSAVRAGLAVRDRLSKSEPGNAARQRDLAVSHSDAATILVRQGEAGEALAELRKARAIAIGLAEQSPQDAQVRKDLAALDAEIAKLEQPGGAQPAAAQPTEAAAP